MSEQTEDLESTEPEPSPPADGLPPVSPDGGLATVAGVPGGAWGPGGALVGILVAIGLTVVGSVPIAFADSGLETTAGKLGATFVQDIGLLAAALGVAIAAAGGDRRLGLKLLGLRRPAVKSIALALAGLGAYLVAAGVLAPLLQPDQEDVAETLGGAQPETIALVAIGLLVVIGAPLVEEVFFRGMLFAGLRHRLPLWAAAVGSAAFWGLLHLTGGDLGVAVQLTVFGVILAVLYERSGSIVPGMALHALNNAAAFAFLVAN